MHEILKDKEPVEEINCFSGKSLGLNQSNILKATHERSEQCCVEVYVSYKGNIPNIYTHAINVWQFRGIFKCNTLMESSVTKTCLLELKAPVSTRRYHCIKRWTNPMKFDVAF